jgi:hypothetical protein
MNKKRFVLGIAFLVVGLVATFASGGLFKGVTPFYVDLFYFIYFVFIFVGLILIYLGYYVDKH